MRILTTLILVAVTLPAQQQPVHVMLDMHVDPWDNNVPWMAKQATYNERIVNMNWVLDRVELLGMKVGFQASGPFMEMVVEQANSAGANASGPAVLRRCYQNGGTIGSHSHTEIKGAAPFDWPALGYSGYTPAEAAQTWTDSLTWATAAIDAAFGGAPPEPIGDILDMKQFHLPEDEAQIFSLFATHGMGMRAARGMRPFYDWFGHDAWQPHRPSQANILAEDLSTPFVSLVVGGVIGTPSTAGITHNMTAPYVKREFLQLYLNWRHDDRLGLPERVWSWGFGGHAFDFAPGSQTRTDFLDVTGWLASHFIGRVEPTGSVAMQWSNYREAKDAYVAWESAHPATSHFDYQPAGADWAAYPYLRAVSEELRDTFWVADITSIAGVTAFHLTDGANDMVVLWRDLGTSVEDLSPWIGPDARVVNLETGVEVGRDPTAVNVGVAPVIVTERVPRLSSSGAASLGSTVTFTITTDPDTSVELWASPSTASINLAHIGLVQLDPLSLYLIGSGVTDPSGSWTFSATVPSAPSFAGMTLNFQGIAWTNDSLTPRVTLDALSLTAY